MNSPGNSLPEVKANILALLRQQRLVEAVTGCRQVCVDEPADPANWFMLATIHGQLGQAAEAISAYDAVLQRQPGNMPAWLNKGVLLESTGDLGQAGQCYRRALEIKPDFAQAWYSLGNLLFRTGDVDGAVDSYRKAIQHQPGFVEALANLGKLQQSRFLFVAAGQQFRKALEHAAGNADLYNELGMSLNAQGRTGEAEQSFRKALAIDPGFHEAGSNLLLTLNYTSNHTSDQVFAEHRRWGRHAGGKAGARQEFPNSADPDRRLRIGYVSADFRDHSVACFITALLECHDRRAYETTCYADTRRADAVTDRLRSMSDHWRDIHGKRHAQVVEMIQADAIDILVDLGGHTAGNRLPVFAVRPAPVQVTYLGYPNTTGLAEMDYRLTDVWCDPPGDSEACYTESLACLPGCFLCYTPPVDVPLPGDRTVAGGAAVVFGSFNSYVKMTGELFEVWAGILKAVPGSRLLLKNFSLTDPAVRAACRDRFAALGIEEQRLELHGVIASKQEHLALYGKVDIGLDTFPYNGTTTTCEALWMGIPVITLAGERHAGRVGASLMNAVGLPQLIAADKDEYHRLAVELGADDNQRRQWRTTLRAQMQASALCDGAGFTRNLELAYRGMWAKWCASA